MGNARRCTVCKKSAGEVSFSRNKLTKDGLSSQCSACDGRGKRIRRLERKRFIVEAAGGACMLCGYDKCIAALEFHHKDKNKEGEVSVLLENYPTRALEEAKKCQLLCANCHREVHWRSPVEDAGITRKRRGQEIIHETISGYQRGCRCLLCKSKWNEYHRNLRNK